MLCLLPPHVRCLWCSRPFQQSYCVFVPILVYCRVCEVAVRSLLQQYPEDQQHWAYGISAAAREAVLYAKQELERYVTL